MDDHVFVTPTRPLFLSVGAVYLCIERITSVIDEMSNDFAPCVRVNLGPEESYAFTGDQANLLLIWLDEHSACPEADAVCEAEAEAAHREAMEGERAKAQAMSAAAEPDDSPF